MSDQFTGSNAIVVPGTLRDSLYLLAVVLEQQTELNPMEIAYTDVVFGLSWLLGFRFSPRMRVVQVTSIMKTLRIDDRLTKLAQAVVELGRIDKTIHALTYIDDKAKCRRTLIQLNRGKERHKLARAIFHGKRRELRQRYREGQEDQLGALRLVALSGSLST